MNQVYRLIWSRIHHAWIAVAEIARAHGKSASARALVTSLTAATSLAISPVWAASAGHATVVGGSGNIVQTGNTTTINQGSQRLAIDWTDLSTSPNEALVFHQPNAQAIALNRITGSSPSTLLGSLTANGQVYILNPNGVLFGAGAQVDVGGLVASTLTMTPTEFMAGGSTFVKAANSTGAVTNQGTIHAADGGYVALLGATIDNQGSISTRSGTTLLAAGNTVTLTLANSGLVGYRIDQGTLNALIANRQLIQADGGQVLIEARALDSLGKAVVNNSGVIDARTVQNRNGHILLLGDMEAGTVNLAGTLDASAANGGDGGTIETSAARVQVADGTRVTTLAPRGRNGTWLIDPTDYTVAASGGDITGATLSSNLSGGNIQLKSTSGAATGSGAININDVVSWNAATTLTLSAQGNININKAIATTQGKLALQYGLGAVAAGNTATYGVHAPIGLPAGGNFSTQLGSDGAVKAFTVITSLGNEGSVTGTDLQGISGNLNANYVLGADIDASAAAGWNGGLGFQPIGINPYFTGVFDGLGHVISNLTELRRADMYIGLFGKTAANSIIRNVGLVGGSMTGGNYVGALVGDNASNIDNSYATAAVSSTYPTDMGGLVGFNAATITNSHATGAVTVVSSITVGASVGGLAGESDGTIDSCYATGNVDTPMVDQVGGLVGTIWPKVSNQGYIFRSYATGSVSGIENVGGLVGYFTGSTISDSYATGDVAGNQHQSDYVGGLVAYVQTGSSITNSYANNHVSGRYVGGFVGNLRGTVSKSFWNVDTSRIGNATAAGNGAGAAAISNADASKLSTFANAGWSVANTGGSTATWRVYEGMSGPLLRTFLTPVTITPEAGTKTYDGSGNTAVTFDHTGMNDTLFNGSLVYVSSRNVGTYSTANGTLALNGLYSGPLGYDISYAGVGDLTINKANLVLTTTDVDKTYDGTTSAAGSLVATQGTGIGTGDTLSGGTFAFADRNVGTGKVVSVSGVTIDDGNGGQNYSISYANNTTSRIDPALLYLTSSDVTKTYDGTTSAAGSVVLTRGALYGGDSINGVTFAFTDKNVGYGKSVRPSFTTVNDGNGGRNYYIVYYDNVSSTINRANLALTTTDVTKTYDGTLSASGVAKVASGSLFAGDSLGGGSFMFTNRNAGSGKAVVTSDVTVGDGYFNDNYNVSYVDNTTSTINRADLTLTTTNIVRTYDGDTDGHGTAFATAGTHLFSNDTLAGGTFTFADKNVGSGKRVSVSGVTVQDGNGGNNYNVTYHDIMTGTIGQAPLYVTSSGVTKVYDGTTSALGMAVATNGTRLFAGDSINGGTFAFTDKNAGTGKTVTARDVTVGDGTNNNNYSVMYTDNTNSTINRANLVLTTTDVVRAYDGTVAAAGHATPTAGTQVFAGDSLSGGTFAFTDKNVGTGKTVTARGVTVGDGINNGNYTITYADNTNSSIDREILDLTTTDVTKLYDGTTSAHGSVQVIGGSLFAGDSIGGESFAFTDRNAGGSKTVKVSGATVGDGTHNDNYDIRYVDNVNSTIDRASLVLSSADVVKTYDGTTFANGTAVATAGTRIFAGDTLSGGNFAFADKNAGNGKTVTVGGVTVVDGNGGQNYAVSYLDNVGSTIHRASLALTTSDVTKTYDGTLSANGVATVASGSLFAGDSLGGGSFTFTDRNAGTGKTVVTSGVTVGDGSFSGNYDVSYVDNTNSAIDRANLVLTTTDVTRTYDGTIAASGQAVATAGTTMFGGDSLSGGTFAFTDKNAGAGKTVTTRDVTVNDGNGGDNYTVSYADNYSGIVLRAALDLSTADITKTYDGTTTANGHVVVDGGTLYAGDSVSGGIFAYSDKNAGAGKTVTTRNATINDGNLGGNYDVTYGDNTHSAIDRAALTVTADGFDKIYDGATGATVAFGDNRVAGDSLDITGTASFADKNAGEGKSILIDDIALNGADARNYELTSTRARTTGDIVVAPLTITAVSDSKFDNGLPYKDGRGVVYTGLVGGDTAASLYGSLSYGGSSQGARDLGSYAIVPGGLGSANYSLHFVDGVLVIRALSQSSAMLGGTTLENAYDGARLAVIVTGTDMPEKQVGGQASNGGPIADAYPISVAQAEKPVFREAVTPRLSVIGCGISMPAGAEAACR